VDSVVATIRRLLKPELTDESVSCKNGVDPIQTLQRFYTGPYNTSLFKDCLVEFVLENWNRPIWRWVKELVDSIPECHQAILEELFNGDKWVVKSRHG
jgi:hypothetical protein